MTNDLAFRAAIAQGWYFGEYAEHNPSDERRRRKCWLKKRKGLPDYRPDFMFWIEDYHPENNPAQALAFAEAKEFYPTVLISKHQVIAYAGVDARAVAESHTKPMTELFAEALTRAVLAASEE